MREFGLIGYPLKHAYSQIYFEEKFKNENIKDAKYTLFPISEISKLLNIIKSKDNLIGLNVTTPYKELVLPYLNEIDKSVLNIGTVNTIKIERNEKESKLIGYNTDIYGLRKTFEKVNLPQKTKALILGSGGSGKTVKFVLKELGIKSTTVSRNPKNLSELSYKNITESVIKHHNLIINASPVGMYPNIEKCPNISYEYIKDSHICFDLVYNPELTLFLKNCGDRGAKCINGFTMLYEQADRAWEIWNKD
ncbi:MAG: shikimate dehydrogenase [Bacteroidales bacterium]|jgi:shikimate dehydrogenase|nr:shikimate dehydrogenase [Bacteroidales bacterium]MCK9498552.1 shikimate dehydrogenase [Bacteroidales bacterium]MDY0314321.1 shikimate dehydrogenase [Bacteroidales bacterium]NLB86988.1 shikimate dehydrogenase [Bacteroidales bacterium]NLB86999.1 shikimate dehydrogenase [Bacteroidales bacterium]